MTNDAALAAVLRRLLASAVEDYSVFVGENRLQLYAAVDLTDAEQASVVDCLTIMTVQ